MKPIENPSKTHAQPIPLSSAKNIQKENLPNYLYPHFKDKQWKNSSIKAQLRWNRNNIRLYCLLAYI